MALRPPPRRARNHAVLDDKLLKILVCPADHGLLVLVDDVLYNPRLHKAYRIEDDIPVLLVDEAVDVGPAEHERLMAQSGS
ncbi:conserved hypothetical protein [uncultured Mycobacterium sp.]|uniref:UPF0434 protein MHPYR_220051 n=1 Tax=uncultured Mycobacterium sp. TaxID=171292 RepID=A0A1Y5P9J8_9MYCO|nr:conserved hypothetical protein [uncultured Mycobacterium sp.]